MNAQLAQLIVNGIAVGSIIALAAVGLTLTYGILRLANFAHGDFMTLGAYSALLANTSGVNIWLSMILGAIATVAAMLLSEKLLWSTMRDRRASSTTLIIISIGLGLFIRNGIILIWGGSNRDYNVPVSSARDFLGLKVPQNQLVVMFLAVLAILALHYLLQNTKIGKAMRAVADDIDLARVSGINVDRVVIWTWVIAGEFNSVRRQYVRIDYRSTPKYGLVFDITNVCLSDFRRDWQPLRCDRCCFSYRHYPRSQHPISWFTIQTRCSTIYHDFSAANSS
jgi:neutral amino acid transport system permease protein